MAAKSQADTTGLAETAAAAKAAADQLVAEQQEAADALAAEQAAADIQAMLDAEAERLAAEQAETERLAAEKAAQDAIDAEAARDLDEINAGLVAMVHPNGGTCDAYEVNEDGHVLVPATEIAILLDHGFVTVVAFDAAGKEV